MGDDTTSGLNIAVVHGPNLNLLGSREPTVYGHTSFSELQKQIDAWGAQHQLSIEQFQSNSEGALVDFVQGLSRRHQGVVVNAGAYTHTSVALADALAACALPYVEVHISNVFAREAFRHHSYLSAKALAIVSGFGIQSYILGLDGLLRHLQAQTD